MSQLEIRKALELAIQAMPGIVDASTILTSVNGAKSLFTTATPHGMVSGMEAKIEGHSSLNGCFTLVVISPTTFNFKDPVTGSFVSVASGTGGTVTPQLTAWENVSFVPQNSQAYQKVNFVFAAPENPTKGDNFYRERGFLQFTLYYPLQTGPYAAMSRAELIRSTFPRGASFSNNGIVVQIDRTAEIMPGMSTDESYIVIVRVPFYANINS